MKLRNSDNTVTIVTEDMFENRVTHERLVHVIEIGQRSTYCHRYSFATGCLVQRTKYEVTIIKLLLTRASNEIAKIFSWQKSPPNVVNIIMLHNTVQFNGLSICYHLYSTSLSNRNYACAHNSEWHFNVCTCLSSCTAGLHNRASFTMAVYIEAPHVLRLL